MVMLQDVPSSAHNDLIKFLVSYGYLKEDEINEDSLNEALKYLQEIAGLKPDGVLGPKTHRVLVTPRCGMSDASLRMAQESIVKWGINEISYFIKNHDQDLTREEWGIGIRKALSSWEKVANLKFFEVKSINEANFVYDIGSGRADNFDGPSGTLAWAYLPSGSDYKGQLLCKFDVGESWILDARLRGILLENVACHETGHLLGLSHSNVKTALMAPYYSAAVNAPVASDDIVRIQKLYGKPVEAPTTPTTPTNPGTVDKLTINLEFIGSLKDVQIPGYRVYKQQ